MITLDRLNRKEAIRYLGGAGISLNYRMDVLMDECEKEILKTAEPRFLYVERKAPFDDILLGNDIKKHLEGCHTAVMMCATIGSEIDKLIRISQISNAYCKGQNHKLYDEIVHISAQSTRVYYRLHTSAFANGNFTECRMRCCCVLPRT